MLKLNGIKWYLLLDEYVYEASIDPNLQLWKIVLLILIRALVDERAAIVEYVGGEMMQYFRNQQIVQGKLQRCPCTVFVHVLPHFAAFSRRTQVACV